MKVYIVGSDSLNPEDWSIWDETAIVIASTPEEAMELANGDGPALEVDMNKPQFLMRLPEPNWGDDI